MGTFEKAYAGLNSAQKKAVDTIDGPVLVIAGPGTGKTQLLSARVAQILKQTDASPQNILCLTFTESGAQNMRDRLTRFIGSAAYDVQIGTYHAFGSDLIRRFPEYFTETRLERPIDELGKRQVLAGLIDALKYSNPLKQTRHHLGDLISTISEVKRGLLSAPDLRAIAAANLQVITACSPAISQVLEPFKQRMPTKLAVAQPAFESIRTALENLPVATVPEPFQALNIIAAEQLAAALSEAIDSGRTKPLTAWKNSWLEKDEHNNYRLDGKLESERMHALADVLEQYESELAKRGLYDFDDMILRALQALQKHDALRYTLQEQYQYILLDEFQDTNRSQFSLIKQLTDNPVHEGRPNVLAVGDDDQAIYAFQGAQYSNMLEFAQSYRDPLLINLSENYRSSAPILQTARNIAGQIQDSLASALPQLDKQLFAADHSTSANTQLSHIEYSSEVAERAAIANRISNLVRSGISATEIAVLAPKHSYLEALVPYLQGEELAVSYERRENILKAPAIRQLLTMSKLCLALHDRNWQTADSLWPEVLSYPFWGHTIASIWQLSWQASDEHDHWTKLLLADGTFQSCGLLFASLAGQVETEPLEVILDRLIGTEEVLTGDPMTPTVRSPFRDYYAGTAAPADQLYQVVTELAVLRARLREHQAQRGEQLTLIDLLDFVHQYEAAEQQLMNTSPYHQSSDAVQLMTVFKAKGLEFEQVFVLHAQDAVWGSGARDMGNKLTLPANLAPIRHAGSSDDERLRALFVACSRAKHGLYFTSHRRTYAGNQISRLKYLDETETDDGNIESTVLPSPYNIVQSDDHQAPALSAIEQDWRARHLQPDATLQALLHDRLQRLRLSPTHLTQFIDLEHAGPQAFLLNTLLRFPSAPSVDIAYGNAMHGVMEWIQQQVNSTGIPPKLQACRNHFSEALSRQQLFGEQFALQEARGHDALETIMSRDGLSFSRGNKPEYSFRQEGVVIEDVLLNGKIDLLEIDEPHKTITVVDYKTGSLGTNSSKLHRYELQLYAYKLLLASSHSFKDYTVTNGKIIFVEPAMNGGKITAREVKFTDAELDRVERLLRAIWSKIQNLDMPDTSSYASSLTGIRQFEQDLLDGTI